MAKVDKGCQEFTCDDKKVFFWLAGIWFTSIGIIFIELTLGVLYLFGMLS